MCHPVVTFRRHPSAPYCTCPGDEREDVGERGAEELRLLTRVLHCDHIEKLQRLRRMKQEEGALRDSRSMENLQNQ